MVLAELVVEARPAVLRARDKLVRDRPNPVKHRPRRRRPAIPASPRQVAQRIRPLAIRRRLTAQPPDRIRPTRTRQIQIIRTRAPLLNIHRIREWRRTAIRRTLELPTLDQILELRIPDRTPALRILARTLVRQILVRQIRERPILLQLPPLAPADKNSCKLPHLAGPIFGPAFFCDVENSAVGSRHSGIRLVAVGSCSAWCRDPKPDRRKRWERFRGKGIDRRECSAQCGRWRR